MISRRQFLMLSQMLGLSALLPTFNSGCKGTEEIKGKILGANASLGHRLRTNNFSKATEIIQTDFAIIGGGVAGLSAARYLNKHTGSFCLLEMEEQVGGNSLGNIDGNFKFPWGAHYLPIPGNNDTELISFLHDVGVITSIKDGIPVYNEYHLCHDPKERLFINNYWQEGVIPHEGVPAKDRNEIQQFLELMHHYKSKTGNDLKPAFSIPAELSSQDENLLKLDSITAEDFLLTHNLKSPYLHWYVNYCCADDFGSSIRQTSAWAMIHYFASRNAKAFNAPSDAVLTWPEGNYRLIAEMEKSVKEKIISNALVYEINVEEKGVTCSYFDAASNVCKQINAKAVILATPQFINQRILKGTSRSVDYSKFEYAPWMVANIVTKHPLNEKRGEPLCWDNVIYGSDSLGYVNASHQEINIHNDKKVITYYKPLLGDNVHELRKQAHTYSFADWSNSVLRDLKKPHADIQNHIEEINIWIWGHGMIRPSKNFISSDNRLQAQKSIDNKIFFAHSDLSGLSIFEEAFYQGHKAAKTLLEL